MDYYKSNREILADKNIKLNNLLKEARKEYSKTETLFNKELQENKKTIIKEKLIRLDERINVYKELLM